MKKREKSRPPRRPVIIKTLAWWPLNACPTCGYIDPAGGAVRGECPSCR